MFVAEEVNHPVDIASAGFHDVVVAHLRLEVNLTEPLQRSLGNSCSRITRSSLPVSPAIILIDCATIAAPTWEP